MLQEAARVLTVRGRLVLKAVNAWTVLTAFRDRDQQKRDGTVVSIARTLMLDPIRLTEKISVRSPGGNGEYERRQRLYRIEDLLAILDRAGFAVAGAYAHPDGSRFDPVASPAIWIVARRRD